MDKATERDGYTRASRHTERCCKPHRRTAEHQSPDSCRPAAGACCSGAEAGRGGTPETGAQVWLRQADGQHSYAGAGTDAWDLGSRGRCSGGRTGHAPARMSGHRNKQRAVSGCRRRPGRLRQRLGRKKSHRPGEGQWGSAPYLLGTLLDRPCRLTGLKSG